MNIRKQETKGKLVSYLLLAVKRKNATQPLKTFAILLFFTLFFMYLFILLPI